VFEEPRMFDARTLKLAALLLAAPALAVLALAIPVAAKTITYQPQTVYFTYCYAHPPAARIASGDSVVTSTRDASNDAFLPTDTTLAPKIDLTKVNPQTGPFFVEGAEPGDTLKVHIDRIGLNRDWGWGGAIPYFGALAPEYKTMMLTPPVQDTLFIWQLDRSRNVAVLNMPKSKIGRVEVPIRGFFGTIGTAPYGKECINWLATDYGYDRMEAYQLLGQTAVIKIANVVDPQYSVACALDKKYLPR